MWPPCPGQPGSLFYSVSVCTHSCWPAAHSVPCSELKGLASWVWYMSRTWPREGSSVEFYTLGNFSYLLSCKCSDLDIVDKYSNCTQLILSQVAPGNWMLCWLVYLEMHEGFTKGVTSFPLSGTLWFSCLFVSSPPPLLPDSRDVFSSLDTLLHRSSWNSHPKLP